MSLIKVQANIAVGKNLLMIGPDAGAPMVVECRWFLKRENKFNEITGIKASCYQPCIDDVGSSYHMNNVEYASKSFLISKAKSIVVLPL